MKTNIKFLMMAAIVCGTLFGFTSCKDDDDKLTEEQKEEKAIEQMDVTNKYWAVVGQLAGSDAFTEQWQDATFAPVIGQAYNGKESVRVVITGDAATAAERFCNLIGQNGAVNESTSSYTFEDKDIGTLVYKKTGGTSLATVDVDIKQMPGLSQVVYMTSDQLGANGDFEGTAYYRFGDVVSKEEDGQTDYWICVRPAFGPEGKEDSHWISLSRLHGNYIKEVKKNGVTHRLPQNLYTSKEHSQNLAELLYAMLNCAGYDNNLTKNYKTLKYFHDFDYKKNYVYNSSGFFTDVLHNWGIDVSLNLHYPSISNLAFGEKSFTLVNNLKSRGVNLIYEASLKSDGVKMKRLNFSGANFKTVTEDSFTYPFTNGVFDVNNSYEKQTNYFLAPVIIGDYQMPDAFNFYVRYKTGKELCKGTQEPAKYDKRKRLTNCQDVYVFNQRMGLNLNMLKDEQPMKSGRTFKPHYRLGDVYVDEAGVKWFVANMAGNSKERAEYSELITFEGLDPDPNSSQVFNVPTREQAQRAMTHLWHIYTAVADKNDATIAEKPGNERSYLNIRQYTGVDIRHLIQRTFAASGDPRQSSQTACIAYYEDNGFDINQPLLRFIMNNQNDAQEITTWFWDRYPKNPSANEQFQREFSDVKLFLQDVNNQQMVDTYAEDHYARQPLLKPSIAVQTLEMREPRTTVEPKANDVTNYFYDTPDRRAAFANFTAPTSMWNEPVIFLRITAARDLGDDDYSTKTLDGHTLRLLHARDWNIEDDDDLADLMTSKIVYYNTYESLYYFNGKEANWPSWKIWQAKDPQYKP